MKKYLLLFFGALTLTNVTQAQLLHGCVVDKDGNAIGQAGMYVSELSQGVATNANGEFELKVAAGKYTCTFQHLSYNTQTITVVVPQAQPLRVVLDDKVYDISEVVIGKNSEDPAYAIMRQAITRAPIYRNQVQHYFSTTYVRGNMRVNKIGSLFKTIGSKEIKANNIKDGDSFLRESISETTFDAPDKYKYTVKAVKNNFPDFGGDMGDLGMERIIEGSIYKESETSPLGHNAFANYRFKYEGEFIENERIVNKIKVTPKVKSALYVNGYIYIFEGTWNVHSFEFWQNMSMAKSVQKGTFSEVRPDVWLPTSSTMNASISAFGANIDINFISSIKYKNLKVNSVDLKRVIAKTNAPTEKYQKAQQKLSTLAAKENLTNRDAVKISKYLAQMEEEKRAAASDTAARKRGKFELPPEHENSVIVTDSINNSLDSSYWNATRPIPLLDYEIESYTKRESIKLVKTDTSKNKNLTAQKTNKFSVGDVILGGSYKVGDSAIINYSGFLGVNSNVSVIDFQRPYVSFNAVDGYNIGQELTFDKVTKDSKQYGFAARADYAFKRKCFMFSGGAYIKYNSMLNGVAYIIGGKRSNDFNSDGTSIQTNAFASTFFKNNLINFYESKFLKIGNNIDIANGLVFRVRFWYANNKQLWNTTNSSWFFPKKKYRPNEPINPYVAANHEYIADKTSAGVNAQLSYTPCMYYRIKGKNKSYIKSAYPTFTLTWRHGQPNIFNSTANFDELSFKTEQTLSFGFMNSFSYKVSLGKFLNNKSMHFSDFEHMMPKEDNLMFTTFADDYKYYQPYAMSTNEWYINANAKYSSSHLLLKRLSLPIIKNDIVQESLHLNYFRAPYVKHFTEVGYSLDNLFYVFNVGVFCGFENFEYKTIRLKIGINLEAKY